MKKMKFLILLVIGTCTTKADPKWWLAEISNDGYGDQSVGLHGGESMDYQEDATTSAGKCEWSEWAECKDEKQTSNCDRQSKWRSCDGNQEESDTPTEADSPGDGKEGEDTTESGGDTTEPGEDTTESEGDATEPGEDTTESGGDTTEPGEDTTESGGDTTEPGEDTTESGGDTTEPGEDTTGSREDTTGTEENSSVEDTTGSGEDTTGAGEDTTAAGEDTTGAGEDTTGAGEDSSGSRCESPNVVKNVESLSAGERTSLLEALTKLKDSPAWGSVASIHGGAPEHTTCEGKANEFGGLACCLHGANAFLTWHRLYLDRMNRDLRQHGQSTAMPYWDWTSSSFPSIANSSDSSFFSGPVTAPTKKRPQKITSRSVNTRELSNTTGFRQKVLAILKEQRYSDFEQALEGIHNDMHVYVGEHMSDLDVASFDPIFYLHHTFIDYIWAVWQVLRPDERPQPEELSRTMHPFGKIAREALECTNYDIDENSNNIVLGGMTFSQIKCETCTPNQGDCNSTCGSDYDDTYGTPIAGYGTTTAGYGTGNKTLSVTSKPQSTPAKKKTNKIYAGFFMRDFGISAHVHFNICKSESYGKEDCTIPGGIFSTFGGSKERLYNSTFPTKIDVTDAVIKAGMNETEMCRFQISSIADSDGNDLAKLLKRWFEPITIFRPKLSQNDVYSFTFKGEGTQVPNVNVPKECTFQIESDGDNVDEDQKCMPVKSGSKSETKSYMQWQDDNREKYNKWNKPGIHTFNDMRCGAENEGSTITITKHGEGFSPPLHENTQPETTAPEPEITAPEPVRTTPEIATTTAAKANYGR